MYGIIHVWVLIHPCGGGDGVGRVKKEVLSEMNTEMDVDSELGSEIK